MKAIYITTILTILFLSLSGCDLFGRGDGEEPIETVILVGTNIPEDFRSTNTFSLTAVPLSETGNGLLDAEMRAEVTIAAPIMAGSKVDLAKRNRPSGRPLAISLDIDASGSTSSTDPTKARLSGAKSFINVLLNSRNDFETAVFEYSRNSARLLQDFTEDVDSLGIAIDRIGSFGDTPTYRSLLQIMDYMNIEKPGAQFERAIVLLSDGQPGDIRLRSEMCAKANVDEIPVYSIGLGPASDIDRNIPTAVNEMRAIAECTGAAYAGIDPANIDESAKLIFDNIGFATTRGSVVFNVELDAGIVADISQGAIVSGTLTIDSGGNTASADFSFRAP